MFTYSGFKSNFGWNILKTLSVNIYLEQTNESAGVFHNLVETIFEYWRTSLFWFSPQAKLFEHLKQSRISKKLVVVYEVKLCGGRNCTDKSAITIFRQRPNSWHLIMRSNKLNYSGIMHLSRIKSLGTAIVLSQLCDKTLNEPAQHRNWLDWIPWARAFLAVLNHTKRRADRLMVCFHLLLWKGMSKAF